MCLCMEVCAHVCIFCQSRMGLGGRDMDGWKGMTGLEQRQEQGQRAGLDGEGQGAEGQGWGRGRARWGGLGEGQGRVGRGRAGGQYRWRGRRNRVGAGPGWEAQG